MNRGKQLKQPRIHPVVQYHQCTKEKDLLNHYTYPHYVTDSSKLTAPTTT